ncbi:MAG TPA: type II toxin-antitoxin system VapC family toxin [Anaerolineales bacterium]|nr:type II toxin-antitoxin system VapC family toxin [Anaerolineales bacterium]
MNVIDSSGWLEYFINGENASFFAPAIQDVANAVVPTISIFEVFKRILIEKGRTDALEAVAIMYDGEIVDLDREIALIAADLSFELKLPMADSIILATARAHNATLWTQDEHFKDIEGVKYIAKKTHK